MTSKMQNTGSELLQERFGHAVGRRLSAGTAELPYHVTERLRAARAQAVSKRKVETVAPAVIVSADRSGALTFGGGFGWWRQIASVLPLVVLAGGLVLIHTVQNERRATEVAEVDAQLLTDDLPPAAYTDPGFIQFLKSSR